MFNTGINRKAGRSVLLANSRCSRDIAGLLAAPWLICIEHASQCASCIAPAKQNGSVTAPMNRMSVTKNSEIFTFISPPAVF